MTEQSSQQHQSAFSGGGESADQLARQFAGKARQAYQQTRQLHQDELIVQYLPLVHRLVAQIASYLQPPLSREDLISAGTVGLVRAARDYDPRKDADFKTYAYIRVRGAILDELRNWSFTPSGAHRLLDKAQQIANDFLQQTGTIADDEYIAEQMNVSLDKLYEIYQSARARHFLSISGFDDESPALGDWLAAPNSAPFSRLEEQELRQTLAEAIRQLPDKQRQVILLYYHRQMTMKEIAQAMELTESRISQLHAAALFRLSVRMNHYLGISDRSPVSAMSDKTE